VGEIAGCYTQGWRETFKIELKTTRYRNCNLTRVTCCQTPALSFVLYLLNFNDTNFTKFQGRGLRYVQHCGPEHNICA
jgi:hypothetical protein